MAAYLQAKAYLDSFIDYERKVSYAYAKALKLDRIQFLLEASDTPFSQLRFIHIAGTKGKGSTATFCAYALAALGYRVGLYTSPHFFDFRERIACIDGTNPRLKLTMISKTDVARLVKAMTPAIERVRASRRHQGLSFFEVYTALAFKYFCRMRPDFVVLETGLGGRLDATNVVTPLVSIITHIGYDHTDKLGSTLAQIAGEKAGIIKPGVPVVTARQAPEVARVITKRCQAQGAPLFALGREFRTSGVELKNNRTRFDFHSGTISISGINTGLRGKYQAENIALGLQAIALASPEGFCANAVKKGIRRTQLAGRFETLCRAPLTIVDIAHNPSAFNALKENLARYYPDRKVILIFAASRDKDIKNMLNKFSYTHLILTRFDNPRAFDPRSIREVCGVRSQATIAANIKEAYRRARKFYGPGALILIAGSFFLAAEAKKLLQVKSIHPRGPARVAE